MKLIDNWRDELNRVWVVKAALFSALLGVADQILAEFQSSLPPVVYSLLFIGIVVVRVLQQTDPEATQPGK